MTNKPDKLQDYAVSRWSDGYFGIAESGDLQITLNGNQQSLNLIASSIRQSGYDLPILMRFPGILRHRAKSLCDAFTDTASQFSYSGQYQGIYPIKVNQQRTVIEQLVKGGGGCIGLEAGSKPELMAVLALSEPGDVIVCNGYKDREYIRHALIGRALGLRLYIVIEKLSELKLVEEESKSLGIEPLLGVRIRLATSASGNWQNSGGEKAKFGLTATQLVHFVDSLKENGKLHWLSLLHSHIGSQIPNLRDIRKGTMEVSRYYAALHKLGANIEILDVGGGLGVDYEGTGSRNYCSINYTLEEYAGAIIETIQHVCISESLPEPDLFSESGRALTAHHAVLITNIIDSEKTIELTDIQAKPGSYDLLKQLVALGTRTSRASLGEIIEEAGYLLEQARDDFYNGNIDLGTWGHTEQAYRAICKSIHPRLNPHKQQHRELLDKLNLQLADKVFLNFSLFQSTPDTWAIEQVFPVVPLTRLNEAPTRNVILHDLTCDSDGCIERYVDEDGVESTLPLHEADGDDYLLGIFLVGAYQEILGDMHNLFGDTHAVNVEISNRGFEVVEIEEGDTVDELLRYVHFDTELMLKKYQRLICNGNLSQQQQALFSKELASGLKGYTYHEE